MAVYLQVCKEKRQRRKKIPGDGKKGRSVGGLNVVRAVTGRYEEKSSESRNNPVNDQSDAK